MAMSMSKTRVLALLVTYFISSVNSVPNRQQTLGPIRVGFQGLPFGRGNPYAGTETGPQYIRNGDILQFLSKDAGVDVVDYGDMRFKINPNPIRTSYPDATKESGGILNIADVSRAARSISDQTEQIAREGRMVISIGGDHSIAIGTINGVANVYENLSILYLDAHADINTVKTSLSGNIHGMPLSFVIKELSGENSQLKQFDWITPRIAAKRVAHIGLRSVDPGERAIIDRLGMHSFGTRDIDRLGIMKVSKRALDKISPNGKRPIHISFDVDVLDDLEIGSQTGTPEPGGLTLREAMTFFEVIQETANIVSVEFTEVNTALGMATNPKRMMTIVKYLAGCSVGYCRGGLTRKQS